MPEAGHAERIDPEELRDGELLNAWRNLAVVCENPFVTPEWFRSSIEVHTTEAPHVIAWRVGGELRGVLPLVSISKGPIKLLRFANARRGDWFAPACRKADEEQMAVACAELLAREGSGWDAIRLDRLDADSSWPQALARPGTEIALGPSRREDVLPYVSFDERGFDGYLADRSRNFRSQLGRRRRRLEREHELAFRMTATPEELEADLDSFFRLHDERWSARGGSTLDTATSRRHLRLFAAAALQRGWLRLWIAEADGQPAAAWYGWRIGGRYCYALAGLSQRYESDALGTVLLAHTMEQAAAEGAATYDLMWGDEAYKQRFATGRRRVSTWILSHRGRPSQALVGIGVRSLRRLEALPPELQEPLKRLRRALRRS